MEWDMFTNCFYLICNLFRIYLIYQFLQLFFQIQADKWTLRLRYLALVLYYVLNNMGFLYFHWSPNVLLLFNMISIFVVTMFCYGRWSHRICASIMVWAISMISEDFSYRLLLKLGIDHILIICMSISTLILFMIVLLVQKFSDFRQGDEISFLEWAVIVFVPGISALISAFALDQCDNNLVISIGGLGLLLLNIFVFYLFGQLTKMYKKQMQLIILGKQNQAYENQLKIMAQSEANTSTLRHDIKNHLLALQQICRGENNWQALAYLHKLLPMVENEEQFVSTGIPVIDGLLNLNLARAKKLGAAISTNVCISRELPIDSMEISVILGNLLDNVISALKNCAGDKKVNIFLQENRGILVLQVENSHQEAIKVVQDTFVTTKETKQGHGMGLRNVKRIVDIYQGEMSINHTADWFSVEILLYLNGDFYKYK